MPPAPNKGKKLVAGSLQSQLLLHVPTPAKTGESSKQRLDTDLESYNQVREPVLPYDEAPPSGEVETGDNAPPHAGASSTLPDESTMDIDPELYDIYGWLLVANSKTSDANSTIFCNEVIGQNSKTSDANSTIFCNDVIGQNYRTCDFTRNPRPARTPLGLFTLAVDRYAPPPAPAPANAVPGPHIPPPRTRPPAPSCIIRRE
ncbi:hypothetical protein M422DRAFT_259171 [Sphaerobolus stellatus SS14]|uniref:Uncharacterized protein n=1 Tax=Sphaerobolus stellatus (strain SS14) TaxID=990650 RepID=A0A0C9V9Q5_SPHS4|nr:hypothetical protein M422DRAFT_259171 [Sphaerobolus stellatus SS14]